MIEYRQTGPDSLSQYSRIPMRVAVQTCYRIDKRDRGLGGFILTEVPVKPCIKDFCAHGDADAADWGQQFDLSNWGFFMAFDGMRPVGGAAVASRTKEVDMLAGRDDLAVLWDIRVDDAYKRQGIGQALFDMAVGWSRQQRLVQMKIECQNNNVPAVRFYHKQGAVLSAIDEYAYYNDPPYRREIQLVWYLDL